MSDLQSLFPEKTYKLYLFESTLRLRFCILVMSHISSHCLWSAFTSAA